MYTDSANITEYLHYVYATCVHYINDYFVSVMSRHFKSLFGVSKC